MGIWHRILPYGVCKVENCIGAQSQKSEIFAKNCGFIEVHRYKTLRSTAQTLQSIANRLRNGDLGISLFFPHLMEANTEETAKIKVQVKMCFLDFHLQSACNYLEMLFCDFWNQRSKILLEYPDHFDCFTVLFIPES